MQRLWTTPEPLKKLTNYVLKFKKNGAKFIKESKNSQKILGAFGAKKKKRRKIQKGAAPKVKNDGPFLWTFFVDLLTSFFRNSFILLRF